MLSERQQKMVDLLDKHVGAEVEGDLETTMVTMIEEPHLHVDGASAEVCRPYPLFVVAVS